MLWSCPDLTADRLLFNVLWTVWICVRAVLEEADLVADFGEKYIDYQSKVPMWIPWRGRIGRKLSLTSVQHNNRCGRGTDDTEGAEILMRGVVEKRLTYQTTDWLFPESLCSELVSFTLDYRFYFDSVFPNSCQNARS